LEIDRYHKVREKHGLHSSWAIWAEETDTPKSNMADISFFDDESIVEQLNPNNILVGLNISGYTPKSFENFHGKGGGAFKIRYATKDTPLWGAYLTDIIKDYPEMESGNVMKYLRKNKDFVLENVSSFREEIADIGAVNPTLYAFGNDTHSILEEHLRGEFVIKKIMHYSHYISKEKYREHVLEIIEEDN
jgi:hypothetical protein